MLLVISDGKYLQYDNRFLQQFNTEKIDYIAIDNHSELADKILSSHEYELSIKDGKIIDINIIKTKAEWLAEQPPPPLTDKEVAKDKLKSIDLKSTNINDIIKRLDIIEELLRIK